MTLIRRNDNYPAISNLFNDILNHDWSDWTRRNYSLSNTTLPSVNIKENQEGFEIEMAAPGMAKEDFKVNVNHGVLSISSEKSDENIEKEENYSRREFNYQSFCRSFSLPTSVDSDKIGAKYENGILRISLPKKEEAKPKPERAISIE